MYRGKKRQRENEWVAFHCLVIFSGSLFTSFFQSKIYILLEIYTLLYAQICLLLNRMCYIIRFICSMLKRKSNYKFSKMFSKSDLMKSMY